MWRKFLPEVLSLSMGFAALDRVEFAAQFLWEHFFMTVSNSVHFTIVVMTTLVDTVLCAILFFIAKRPKMWRHLIFYLSGWVLFVVITTPHGIWGWPDIIWWMIFELLLWVAVPAALVCLVYAILFVFRFDTNTTQGGENK